MRRSPGRMRKEVSKRATAFSPEKARRCRRLRKRGNGRCGRSLSSSVRLLRGCRLRPWSLPAAGRAASPSVVGWLMSRLRPKERWLYRSAVMRRQASVRSGRQRRVPLRRQWRPARRGTVRHSPRRCRQRPPAGCGRTVPVVCGMRFHGGGWVPGALWRLFRREGRVSVTTGPSRPGRDSGS